MSKKNGKLKYRTPSLASFRKPGAAIVTNVKPAKAAKGRKKEVENASLTKRQKRALAVFENLFGKKK